MKSTPDRSRLTIANKLNSPALLLLLIGFFTISELPLNAQNMNPARKERKRVWRKWNKNNQSYNPYLDRKAKNKPSAIQARQDKRDLNRQKKVARKQMRRSKKSLNR